MPRPKIAVLSTAHRLLLTMAATTAAQFCIKDTGGTEITDTAGQPLYDTRG